MPVSSKCFASVSILPFGVATSERLYCLDSSGKDEIKL
jgi:hypothetical protein